MKEEYDIKNLNPRKNPYVYLINHLNDEDLLQKLDNLYIENTITLSKDIIDNNIDSLNDMAKGNYKYNNKIFNNSSNDVQVAYLMGKCDGQYELADAWAERYKNDMQFEKDVNTLCEQSSHVLDILFTIYKEPGITNEELIKVLSINIGERDMQELIDKLIDIAAIVKYSDKCAFYELTDRAINYVQRRYFTSEPKIKRS